MNKKAITLIIFLLVVSFSLNVMANGAIYNIKFGETKQEVKNKLKSNKYVSINNDKIIAVFGTDVVSLKFYYKNNKLYKVERTNHLLKGLNEKQAKFVLDQWLKDVTFLNGKPIKSKENYYKWKNGKVITTNKVN